MKDSNDYKGWLVYARSSYNYSKTTNDDFVLFAHRCQQAHQTAEYALKGLLIFYGEEPEHTHNIRKLLENLNKYTVLEKSVNSFIDLNTYAFQTRYPGDYKEITEEEYLKAVELAGNCLTWVENKIKERQT